MGRIHMIRQTTKIERTTTGKEKDDDDSSTFGQQQTGEDQTASGQQLPSNDYYNGKRCIREHHVLKPRSSSGTSIWIKIKELKQPTNGGLRVSPCINVPNGVTLQIHYYLMKASPKLVEGTYCH